MLLSGITLPLPPSVLLRPTVSVRLNRSIWLQRSVRIDSHIAGGVTPAGDGLRTCPLLKRVGQLMCQQPLTVIALRGIIPCSKINVAATGKGVGAEPTRSFCRNGIGVYADFSDIIVETGFHEVSCGGIQWTAGGLCHIGNHRGFR